MFMEWSYKFYETNRRCISVTPAWQMGHLTPLGWWNLTYCFQQILQYAKWRHGLTNISRRFDLQSVHNDSSPSWIIRFCSSVKLDSFVWVPSSSTSSPPLLTLVQSTSNVSAVWIPKSSWVSRSWMSIVPSLHCALRDLIRVSRFCNEDEFQEYLWNNNMIIIITI